MFAHVVLGLILAIGLALLILALLHTAAVAAIEARVVALEAEVVARVMHIETAVAALAKKKKA